MIAFTTVESFLGLLGIRFITGFFQVFLTIYFPVWADAFGADDKQKTAWMTILLLATPIGVLLGYILTAYSIYLATWRWTFYIQAFGFIPLLLAIFLTPIKYLDLEALAASKHKKSSTGT